MAERAGQTSCIGQKEDAVGRSEQGQVRRLSHLFDAQTSSRRASGAGDRRQAVVGSMGPRPLALALASTEARRWPLFEAARLQRSASGRVTSAGATGRTGQPSNSSLPAAPPCTPSCDPRSCIRRCPMGAQMEAFSAPLGSRPLEPRPRPLSHWTASKALLLCPQKNK